MLDIPTALPVIRTLDATALQAELDAFGGILHACVHGGASVGFVMPFPRAEADGWWRETVLPPLGRGERVLVAAELEGRVVGTGQLILAQMPNQRHRAEISKVLVHPDFRRRGIARAIMLELERHALLHGKRTLTLDTRTGDAAEPLYASVGFLTAGMIPGYCRHPMEERLEATTYMYKPIGGGPAG